MLNYAVANPALDETTPAEPTDTPPVQPTAFGRISNLILGTKNRVTSAILDRMIPDSMERTYDEIGCVVEYEGETQMIEIPGRMGIEVEQGDLIFVNSDGVWFGLAHYDDMPPEIDTYNFITSGSRSEYNALVDTKLEGELSRQRDVVAFLMAA